MVQLDALARIAQEAKQLEWALKEFLQHFAKPTTQPSIARHLKSRSDLLLEVIRLAFPNGEPDCFASEITTLKNTVDLLEVMGYLGGLPISNPSEKAPPLLAIPRHTLSDFSKATEAISKYCDREREEAGFREQAKRAIEGGVLEEWAKRNIGRGAVRQLGPFLRNVRQDGWDEIPECWTEIELFEYPAQDSLEGNGANWVSCKTDFHRALDRYRDREIRVINDADAARIVLDSEESVDIEILKWAKRHAAPIPKSGSIPVWDKESRTLSFEGKLARKVSSARATNVIKVLDTFHDDGWPPRIDSPFPPDETTLRDTIKSLNSSISGLQFRADGTGEGIEWVPVRAQPNDDLPPY